MVFGAEPKDYELFEYVLRYYTGLHFSPAVDTVVKDIAKNPKRIQREARKQTSATGIGTKSQQAIKLQQEQNKQERKIRSREQKLTEEKREFELKQQKKRASGTLSPRAYLDSERQGYVESIEWKFRNIMD